VRDGAAEIFVAMTGARSTLSTMGWKRYWDIIVYRTYAELKAEAQLSYMGYVWWVLEPLLNTILFYVLLAAILEQPTVGAISFIVVGAVTWQWFNASLMGAANSVVDAGGILRQIYLPKVVLPLISILSSTWKFLFLFVLLLVFVWVTGHPPTLSYLALPLLLVLEFAAIVAFTLPLAFIMPYFPDARVTIDAILRSVMLVSGIFFPVATLPKSYRVYFHLNPMADLIEGFRDILLDGHWPRWDLMVYVAGICFVGLLITMWLHSLVDRSMVKAIHR
jgi:lipopolysaccharide transport system permease protein